jgi:hypothetical protein
MRLARAAGTYVLGARGYAFGSLLAGNNFYVTPGLEKFHGHSWPSYDGINASGWSAMRTFRPDGSYFNFGE